jgi:hypothetical protein
MATYAKAASVDGPRPSRVGWKEERVVEDERVIEMRGS